MTQQEFFERYKFNTDTDHLGDGGFGEVFKAYDTHLDRWVAIKKSQVKKGMENFSLQKEVELATNLPTHPNIAHYEACYRFDIPMLGTFDFGILQYYEEGNLSSLRKAGKITNANLYSILEGMLNGLSHLHKHNVIHRDIKPANILIVKRGNEYIPKITDFGISKQGSDAAASAVSNSLAGGTFSYASPEQLKGEIKIRHNTDLWSFGVIVYQLMTNKLPFESNTLDTNSEISRNEVTSLILSGKLPNDIDLIEQPYQTIIKNCLVLDKMARAQSADDLIEILHGKTITTITPPTVDNNQNADKTKIETKNDKQTKQLSDDETIVEKTETETKEEKKQEKKKVPLTENKNKKNKFLILSLIFGVLLAVILFVWQPWSNSDIKDKEDSNEFSNYSETDEEVEIEMIAVEGGTFNMGCTNEQDICYESELPVHSVTLSSYYIGKYEVTQGQWKAVMGINPSDSDHGIGDNYPVNNVSWNDIQAFITRLNQKTGKTYRLPTEAEWEFAARGGNNSNGYEYSGSNALGNVAWSFENTNNKSHQVGQKSPNELGIYDMSGNVWEWCSDWYGNYSSSSQTNPKGPSSGSDRVLRGGSWGTPASQCRVPCRVNISPDSCDINYGFRLVLVP